MLKYGFMSEISTYERIILGDTEKQFLSLIAEGPKSAYQIFKRLKLMASTKTRSMAYKNVHTRIKRLQELQLIERVKGNFKRKAIKYRLTSRGLFQRLLISPSLDWSFLNRYKDDIIIQTILFQYFEVETIRELSSLDVALLITSSVGLLVDYLRKCCEIILKKLERFRSMISGFRERVSAVTETEGVIDQFIEEMDKSIRYEIKDFVFQIVTFSKYEQQNQDLIFSNLVLSKDKKFIGLVQEIKTDFDDGCKCFGLQ